MGKEVAAWKEALKEDAKQIAHNEGTDSSAITITSGMLMYREQPVPGNSLDVIVIASSTEHCLYEGDYDPDNIASPDCFAQSLETRDLIPHENVAEPLASACDDCVRNRFPASGYVAGKTAPDGGKWCKQYRKLIMVPADTTAEDIARAELAYLKISPTSVKNWSKYVQHLVASAGIPPWAAKTRISVKPDKKTIHRIEFEGIGSLEDDALLSGIHARIEDAESRLMQPYTYEEDESGEDAKY